MQTISILTIFLIILAIIFKKRWGKYGYNTKYDYIYTFKNVTKIDIEIFDGNITIPRVNNRYDTAILEIEIKSKLLGYIFEPYIELIFDNNKKREYFEFGVEGIRYLNISSTLLSKDSKIKLRTNHVRIVNKKSKILLFKNLLPNNKNILLLSPHPDDAEIAAFGVYNRYYRNIFIATISAGESGYPIYSNVFDDIEKQYLEKGKIRSWNSVTIPLLSGVKQNNSINLGFFDSTLSKMYEAKDKEVTSSKLSNISLDRFRELNISNLVDKLDAKSTWNSLVDNIKDILQLTKPEIVILPHPQLDSNADHRYTYLAFAEAIEMIPCSLPILYLYTNHSNYNEYYPYGPSGTIVSLPPNFTKDTLFDSIVSLSLSKDMQSKKLLALEANSDLRSYLRCLTIKGSLRQFLSNLKKLILSTDNSYFRRAVKDNELFFIIDNESTYKELTKRVREDG